MPDEPPPIPEPQPADRARFVHPLDRIDLQRYAERLRLAHGSVKLLGLPDLDERNDDLPLVSLFVEPGVSAQRLSAEEVEERPADAAQTLLAALAGHQRLVLLGDPGAGKSTVVNWLCTALSQPLENAVTSTLGRLIPLPIILRDLPLGVDLTWDALLGQFLARPVAGALADDPALVPALLESGQAIVLLDGLDEVGGLERREALREAVWEGWRRYPKCRWVLTSRVVGYEEVEFDHVFNIWEDEDEEEVAVTFEEKVSFASILYLAPFTDGQVRQFAENWYRIREPDPALQVEGPRNLVEAIKVHTGTSAIARNPNLLTLIALVYRLYGQFPDGRAKLYEKISEAYLNTIDRYRQLPTDAPYPLPDKLAWLARVGWEMQQRRAADDPRRQKKASEILATESDLLGWLSAAMRARFGDSAKDEAARFIDYLQRRTGLILARGEGRFAFLHLSFQEFFAGHHWKAAICDDDWVLANLGGSGTPDAETSLATLASCAEQRVWHETLIFLFESLSDQSAKKTDNLARKLCPELRDGLPERTTTKGDAAPDSEWARWEWLARLAVNASVRLDRATQQDLLRVCWHWQLREQQESPHWGRHEVARALFSRPALREDSVKAMIALAEAIEITNLGLAGCTGLTDLSALSQLHHLQGLILEGCSAIEEFGFLSRLTGLKVLNLGGCRGLQSLDFAPQLTKLETLSIAGCPAVPSLEPLRGLKTLQGLFIDGCTGLTSLAPLTASPALRVLQMDGCTGIQDWSPIAQLRENGVEIYGLPDEVEARFPEPKRRGG